MTNSEMIRVLRVLYCIDFETYCELTGFSGTAEYNKAKWKDWSYDLAKELVNYDQGIQDTMIQYALNKLEMGE